MEQRPDVVRQWIKGVLAGIFAPEPNEEIWEWAERTLRIPATENEEMANQLWRSYHSPYVRELLKWMKRPGKGEFWIKKSSQVGFTMAVIVIICWMIVHRSGNVAYATHSVGEAREISKTRLKKWIEMNRLLESIGESEDDLSNLTYYLRSLTVFLMGSHSSGALSTKSIVLFILDELDKHPFHEGEGTTPGQARGRVKRPKNAKLIGFSTPGMAGLITKEHAAGTCEEIRFPFPCCGHVQALNWDNMIFGTDEFRDLAGAYDLEKVKVGTYFKCEMCADGRLFDHQKMEAMQDFESVPTNKKAHPGVRSMYIWDAYSAFVTFGDLAVQWIMAQGDVIKLEEFMRQRRGLHFEQSGGGVSQSELLDLRGAYRRGECPKMEVVFYAMAVDVQQEKDLIFKATKAVFNEEGDMAVIDWMEAVNFNEIIDFADEPLETPDGLRIVTTALIDEGHEAEVVRKFCILNQPRFFPVKGRGGRQVRATVAVSKSWLDGQIVKTYHVDDRGFKWQLLYRLRQGKQRSEKFGHRRIFLPEDVVKDEGFLEELTNEVPVKKKNQFGQEYLDWKKKGPNDYWDDLKYLLALWTIISPALLAGLAAPGDEEAGG